MSLKGYVFEVEESQDYVLSGLEYVFEELEYVFEELEYVLEVEDFSGLCP
jgi:hypothetical protein